MMKIIVSDSTPLITLMKAEKLNLLEDLFKEVILPEAVFNEVTTSEKYKDEAALIKKSRFLKVVRVEDTDRVEFLQRVTGLDRDESEAIIYADASKADLLLIDEAPGRRVALNMNLAITGSVGILIRAFREGLISADDVDEALNKIQRNKRHISEKLMQDARSIIYGEI